MMRSSEALHRMINHLPDGLYPRGTRRRERAQDDEQRAQPKDDDR
jgi:hypothetical protein